MTSLALTQPHPSFSTRLQWYGKRLRVMPPSEWLFRLRQQQQIGLWGIKHHLGLGVFAVPKMSPEQFTFCANTSHQLPELTWSFSPTNDEADRLIRGKMGAFSHEWNWSPDPLFWHRAPDTHHVWPREFFQHIPYREGNPYGDIRMSWEPSRLQHLLPLALIVQNGPEHVQPQAMSSIEAHFLSWKRANPFPVGIHYISAMECALRILAVCHALDMVRRKILSPSLIWPALLSVIYAHAQYIAHRMSQHSSSGNHTIAESVGLIYAGILFPEFPEAPAWLSRGLSVFEEAATSQILPDGGGVEQSAWYLRFITDLVGLVIQLLQHHGHSIPSSIRNAYFRGTHFLSAFADTHPAHSFFGDSDTGYALSPYVLFPQPTTSMCAGLKQFPHAGYSLITHSAKKPTQLRFDHGPLGMAPSYGHGHADALSVTLSVGDQCLLRDSGTFTYTGDPTWRKYFRGTSAHNTVVVDGLDQSIQETSFMWSQPFQCTLIRDEQLPDGSIRLLAFHNGYASRTHVIHWRGIFYRPNHQWVIWDYLDGSDNHTVELFWHVGTSARQHDNAFELASPTGPFWLEVDGGALTTHRGETNPPLGWHSTSYGRKEPATTIRSMYTGPLPYEFITTIGPQRKYENDHSAQTLLLFRRWAHEN